MVHLSQRPSARRSGLILLIVILLLSLFMTLGLAFLLYTEAEMVASNSNKEAANLANYAIPNEPAQYLFSWGLGQLIYDVKDDDTGVYSGLRGHSLARTMYGWNDDAGLITTTTNPNTVPFNGKGRPSTVPGTAHSMHPTPPGGESDLDDLYLPNYTVFANDTQFPAQPAGYSPFIRDPDRLAPNPYQQPSVTPPAKWRTSPSNTAGRGPYAGGPNVPFTYPDLNNFYLAAVKADGTVMSPSFHRNWLFNPNRPLTDLTNPNWTNALGKYMTLRPRPVDQLSQAEVQAAYATAGVPYPPTAASLTPAQQAALQAALNSTIATKQSNGTLFPYPADNGGDVKQLRGAPGGNDSIWVDLGYPVHRLPDGRKYKALYAFLVRDLDSLVNLNVHGNLRYQDTPTGQRTHLSNKGWGPWEVNPGVHVLTRGSGEWKAIFNGVTGRYGSDVQPGNAAGVASTFAYPPFYSRIDFDSATQRMDTATSYSNLGSTAMSYFLPNFSGGAGYYTPFPYFRNLSATQTSGYDNIQRDLSANPQYDDNGNHPSLYNYYNPNYVAGTLDRAFSPLEMKYLHAINRNTDPDAYHPASASSVGKLLAQNLYLPDATEMASAQYATLRNIVGEDQRSRIRNLLTLLSMEVDRPGFAPYIWDLNDPVGLYQLIFNSGGDPSLVYGRGGPSRNVLPADRFIGPPPPAPSPAPPAHLAPAPGMTQFTADWRDATANLGRVDLSRPLAAYPAGTPVPASATSTAAPIIQYYKQVLASDPAPTAQQTADTTAYDKAVADRVQLATDIFNRLQLVTGAMPPVNAYALGRTSPQFRAVRWLAQLAVNIVDYIDYDNYSTPFTFYTPTPLSATTPPEIVYGTELPRLLLNEAYAQWDNDKNDSGIKGSPLPIPVASRRAKDRYHLNVYVELHNPLRIDNNLYDAGSAYLDRGPLVLGGTSKPYPQYAPYQVVVTAGYNNASNTGLRTPENTLGDPDPAVPGTFEVSGAMDFRSDPTNPNASNRVVLPANGAASDPNGGDPTKVPTGFFVVGPPPTNYLTVASDLYDANPNIRTTMTSPALQLTLPDATVAAATAPPKPTVLLRKLLCEALPPNPLDPTTFLLTDPSLPYNPYITVDYIEDVRAEDGRKYTNSSVIATPTPMATRKSSGRNQPYAAHISQRNDQNPTFVAPAMAPTPAPQPLHTFYSHNVSRITSPPSLPVASDATLKAPFDWLVHLDRPLVSPMELLHVSGFKPHELTQQFMNKFQPTTPQRAFDHYAHWFEEETRLARFFEFAKVTERSAGSTTASRTPGKININTVWDIETLLALCDPQAANEFNSLQLTEPTTQYPPMGLLDILLRQRTPDVITTVTNTTSMAVVNKGSNVAIPLNAVSGAHPISGKAWSLQPDQYILIEPGTPTMERLKITSVNTAAKIITVQTISQVSHPPGAQIALIEQVPGGYDRPIMQLAAGYGNSNAAVSAVSGIDRPVLGLGTGFTSVTNLTAAITNNPAAQAATVTQILGAANGVPWFIQPGMVLSVGVGPTQERVVVASVNHGANTFNAVFTKDHAVGEPIALHGIENTLFRSLNGLGGGPRLLEVPGALSSGPGVQEMPGSATAVATLTQAITSGPAQVVTVSSVKGMANVTLSNGASSPVPWSLLVGTPIAIDAGNPTNQEVVVVQAVDPIANTIQAVFTKNHASGDSISLIGTHPYVKDDLLTKIFNNVTSRSNVFAVWCTVGFFEVTDDSTRPVKLGGELNLATGQNIRYQMFTVLDRTNLSLDPTDLSKAGPRPVFFPLTNAVTAAGALAQSAPFTSTTAAPASLNGSYEGAPWKITVGMYLVVDTGPNQEVVQVTAVDTATGTWTASFTKVHAAAVPVSTAILGNPGPQPFFDYRNPLYSGIVRFLYQIQ